MTDPSEDGHINHSLHRGNTMMTTSNTDTSHTERRHAEHGVKRTALILTIAVGALIAVAAVSPTRTTIATVTPTPAPTTPSAVAGPAADGIAPADSIYCRALAGRETAEPNSGTNEQISAGWIARRDFEFRAEVAAPAAIHADWQTVSTHTRDVEIPRAAASGYSAPVPMVVPQPADVVAARTRIARFDAEVCGVPAG